jgi:hypothetical protein
MVRVVLICVQEESKCDSLGVDTNEVLMGGKRQEKA